MAKYTDYTTCIVTYKTYQIRKDPDQCEQDQNWLNKS